VNQRSKLISAAAAVLLGASAVAGVALAERQTEPATVTPTQNQSLAPDATATATPATAAAPAAGGQASNALGAAARQARRDDFLNALAQNLNISRSTLNGALQASLDQEIDKAVAGNQLTAQQAARLKARIAKGKLPLGLQLGGAHPGPAGQAGS
jgi:hypothetical protein